MKINSLMKIFIFFSITLLIFSYIVPNLIYATEPKWNSTTQFDDKNDKDLNDSVRKVIGSILNVTRIIGTGMALIMLVVVAIKYMMAAPGERADIKKHAIPFVIGAVVLFGASGILTIIQNFAINIG